MANPPSVRDRLDALEKAVAENKPSKLAPFLQWSGGVIAAVIAAYALISTSSDTPPDCSAVYQRIDSTLERFPDAPIRVDDDTEKTCDMNDHVAYVRTQVKRALPAVPTGVVPSPSAT